jgi:hypothetical protein
VAWVAGPAVPREHGGASGAIALALASPLGRGPSRRLSATGAPGDPEPNGSAGEVELDTGVFAGVWRRSTLERLGTWDPRWLRNQDSELAARFLEAGERIVSLPGMAAEYIPRRTLRGLWRQYHGYGRYRARTLLRHPVARRRSHTFAPALVAALPAATAGPRVVTVPARIALGAYAAVVSLETLRAVKARPPLRDLARVPVAFGAIHFGFGIGLWRGLAVELARPARHSPLELKEVK